MKRVASLVAGLLICCSTFAQKVVDEVRLEYFDKEIASMQIGMSVSHDRQFAAFAYENKELRIFDLANAKFVRSFTIDFAELAEIRYSSNDDRILIISTNKVSILNVTDGTIVFEKSYENPLKIADVSQVENVFVLGTNRVMEVIDMNSFEVIFSIPVANDILSLSFHPTRTELILYQRVGMHKLYGKKNVSQIYNYRTRQLVRELPRIMQANFTDENSVVAYYVRLNGYFFMDYDLTKPLDSAWVMWSYTQQKSRDKKEKGGLTFFTKVLHHGDKYIATGGYRGFTVLQEGGGEAFTTKVSKSDRSSSKMGMAGDYAALTQYPLNEDKVLVNAYGNNINQIYSVSQNKIVGNIFTDGDGDFAIVSRDGRFDGTSESSEKLYWSSRKSSKKTRLSTTFQRGFTPGLLPQLMGSREVLADFDIDREIDLIPTIRITSVNGSSVPESEATPELSSAQKLTTVSVSVTENAAEVSSIKLFQNNKLIAVNEGGGNHTFEVNLTNAYGSNNYIYAVAESNSGIESEKETLIVSYTGQPDAKPRLFLVTVGINEYRNPKYNLNYAIADADALKETLTAGASGIFDKIHHVDIRNSAFTREGLASAMREIQGLANEQDMLIFYYAGHGVMSEGSVKDIEFFFVPHDVTQLYGRDDLLYEKAIPASEIEEMSRRVNAQKQVFILDACQSAGALDAMARRGAAEEQAIAKLARSTGTFWITATGSDQFATEFEQLGHGIFTYALIEGLTGKADASGGDNTITVRELTAYIESRVPELSEQYKGKLQFPSSYSFGNDFPIAVY